MVDEWDDILLYIERSYGLTLAKKVSDLIDEGLIFEVKLMMTLL